MSAPRLGFVGVGWIGLHRMNAAVAAGAEVVGLVEPDAAALGRARESTPGARVCDDLPALLALEPDGVVIASPSALHASQSVAALERGVAVFCQKPLARTRTEAEGVVEAARRANRLLAVDLSYRGTRALSTVRQVVREGGIGRVFAVELTFHNGYGPDKHWFYDRRSAGGGCVMDLGTHLVDAVLWVLDFPRITGIDSRLFAKGCRITGDAMSVEDFARARLDVEGGIVVDLACSWNLHVGADCVLSVQFYGTEGAVGFSSVNGSFYDFLATQKVRTTTRTLVEPPDDWGGREIARFVQRLARGERHDERGAAELLALAGILDGIYGLPSALGRVAGREASP